MIIDLLIRTCFIQGLYDEWIKTIVKMKGSINTPMAHLVEVALEKESGIRLKRFKETLQKRGSLGIKRIKMYTG